MYGIVEISGHQYKVKAGDLIDVEKLPEKLGKTIKFNEVLFVGGEVPQVGMPAVKGAQITAKILKHAKSKKVIVFKRSPGHYRKKKGHRQQYTALLITEIKDGQGKVDKVSPQKREKKPVNKEVKDGA